MMSEDNEQRLTNIDHTLDLMDFDGSDDLDINEFFEVCVKTYYCQMLFSPFSFSRAESYL